MSMAGAKAHNGWPRGKRRGPQKPYCTDDQWLAQLKVAAEEAGVPFRKVITSNTPRVFHGVRWQAFRALVGAGFSIRSISEASGFDRSTIVYSHREAYRQRKMARLPSRKEGVPA